jgi:hypothetical protein
MKIDKFVWVTAGEQGGNNWNGLEDLRAKNSSS